MWWWFGKNLNSPKSIIIHDLIIIKVGCLATCYFARRNYQVELHEYREDIRTLRTAVGRSINMAISVRGREGLRGIGCEELVTSKGIEMHSRMLHDVKGNMSAVRYGKADQSILSIDRRYMNELLLTGTLVYDSYFKGTLDLLFFLQFKRLKSILT
jgi:hypothetical protein